MLQMEQLMWIFLAVGAGLGVAGALFWGSRRYNPESSGGWENNDVVIRDHLRRIDASRRGHSEDSFI